MKKKYINFALLFFISSVAIVFFLLGIVTFCEKNNIHVAGSREMWIGLVGSIIGGMYTLIGVLLTIYKQQGVEEENKRIENMPILGFEVIKDADNIDAILSCENDELFTTAFIFKEQKYVVE